MNQSGDTKLADLLGVPRQDFAGFFEEGGRE